MADMAVDSPHTAEEGSGCLVCGHGPAVPLYPGLVRCLECRHVAADVRLSDDELRRLYAREYFFGGEYSDYLADRPALKRNFRARLSELSPFLKPDRHRRLLEIGCAYGFFLDVARDRFESTLGVDIAGEAVRHAREVLDVDAVCAEFLEYDLGSRRFDVVCLWDTIEHLRRPDQYVEKIRAVTEPGALLAITTGDIDSVVARMRGRAWRLIHPPTHLHYFSRRTLGRMLEQAGFSVLSARYCGFYRSVENMAYNILMLRRHLPAPYRLLGHLGITRLDVYCNLFDILHVIAVRR